MIFEKGNIFNLDSKGEVLLTILSSLEQDEEYFENVTWEIHKRLGGFIKITSMEKVRIELRKN